MDANPSHRGRNHIVSFLDHFEQSGPEGNHICLVFEPLGENLLALIERHKKTGVAIDLVRVIAKQMLLGLQYLHDECDLVHTDIKPENILISIPDVEMHIESELSRSPSPTSRKVAVPAKQMSRTVAIPRHKSRTERQVQIFDSQPLSSPSSYSCPNSPARLSYISRVASAQSALASLSSSAKSMDEVRRKSVSKLALTTAHFKSTTVPLGRSSDESSASGSGSSSSVSRHDSALVSSSAATSFGNDALPTSIASVANGVEKLTFADSLATHRVEEPCTCTCGASDDASEGRDEQDVKSSEQPSRPAAGPSLLSQTAPPNLVSHPSTCSQHPHPLSSQAPPETISSDPDAVLSEQLIPEPPPLPISIKIADLGNATPTRKHYTEDIQTRQYRAPEAIVGRNDWGATADIWSVACVVFELLTAEYMFDPQSQGDLFGKDDDHIAQIIELMGEYGETKWGGRFSRELFDSSGNLRYIRNLKPWPLRRVMVEKYVWSEGDAQALCKFLEPMLVIDHRERARARELVDHPWLEVDPLSEDLWGW